MAEEMYELSGVNVASATAFSIDEKGNIEIIDRGIIKFREENEILAAPTQEAAIELLRGTNVLVELDESRILFLLGPNSTTMFIAMPDGTQEKINLPANISKDAMDAVKNIPADEPDRINKIYETLKSHNISIEYDPSNNTRSPEPDENSIGRVITQEGQVIDGKKGAPNMVAEDHELVNNSRVNNPYERNPRGVRYIGEDDERGR